MHEMAYLKRIVNAVVTAGEQEGAKEIETIELVVGELRDFVDDFVQGYFSFCARGTIAEHATIIMERVPFTVQCQDCGKVYRFDLRDDSTTPCPACGSRNYRLKTGRELFIRNVRMVMPGEDACAAGDGGTLPDGHLPPLPTEAPDGCPVPAAAGC